MFIKVKYSLESARRLQFTGNHVVFSWYGDRKWHVSATVELSSLTIYKGMVCIALKFQPAYVPLRLRGTLPAYEHGDEQNQGSKTYSRK